MSKKTKFFRIARAGSSIDGREITAQQLTEMADTYNLADYTAVINMEHYRGIHPDSAFCNYGSVRALEIEKDGNHVYLTAQLDPNPNLIELNKKGQKLFTSIEISPNFAKSGKAYLYGLAITDSPASMGTEMLSFSIKDHGEIHFSDMENLDDISFSAEEDKPSLISQVKNIFSKQKQETAENIEDVSKAVMFLTERLQELSNKIDKSETSPEYYSKLSKELSDLKDKFTAQTALLSKTPAGGEPERPDADGGSQFQTNC